MVFLGISNVVWLYALIVVISFFPFVRLVLIYRRTSIFEYLIFALTFLSFSFYLATLGIGVITDNVISWQINQVSLNTAGLLLFVYSVRLSYDVIPNLISAVVAVWYIILLFIITMFDSMTMERSKVLFWEMDPHIPALPFSKEEIGAGYQINDIVIYSIGHRFISELFLILVAIILVYSVSRVELGNPTPRVFYVHKVWKLISGLILASAILQILWITNRPDLVVGFLAITYMILLAYISLKYPEGIILTWSQIIRAQELYQKASNSDTTDEEMEVRLIRKYLNSIPSKLEQKE